ncbi:hypothetical protein E2C01_038524 [Portunus trituberculatus]|uniref:Uncharacterized protein n=1 Tax=Portunus trituberculatus TaxID=210409 RepID=A0A5B7FKC7_PORTR|nr:hypothetical protein [Portunus trituberculatus]
MRSTGYRQAYRRAAAGTVYETARASLAYREKTTSTSPTWPFREPRPAHIPRWSRESAAVQDGPGSPDWQAWKQYPCKALRQQ